MASYTHINSLVIEKNGNVYLTGTHSGDYWTITKCEANEFIDDSYVGSSEYFYKLDINEASFSELDEFPPNAIRLGDIRFSSDSIVNIEFQAKDLSDTKLQFRLYKVDSSGNKESSLPALSETVTLSSDFETYTINGYVKKGLYALYIFPDYATVNKNRTDYMSFVIDNFTLTSTEEGDLFNTELYYLEECPDTRWVPIWNPDSTGWTPETGTYELKPTSKQTTLSAQDMTHPFNNKKANLLNIPSTKSGEVYTGFATYITKRKNTDYYLRLLAKAASLDATSIRVIIYEIDAQATLNYEYESYEELYDITDINRIHVYDVIENNSYTLDYNVWTEISIDFRANLANADYDDVAYLILICPGAGYGTSGIEFLVNNVRLFKQEDVTNGVFDPYLSEKGTFDKPFTHEHGYIVLDESVGGYAFKTFSGFTSIRNSYIEINNKNYYKVKYSGGRMYTDELVERIQGSPSSGYQYFKYDGKMARNEYTVSKDGLLMHADDSGEITYPVGYVKELVPEYENIDAFTGEAFNFTTHIQCYGDIPTKDIKITAESTDEDILEITNVSPGTTTNEIYVQTFKAGICNIRLTYTNEGGYITYATIIVRVLDQSSYTDFDITALPRKDYLEVGQTTQLGIMFSISTPANFNYEWESSNPNVATVSKTGLVTAKEIGTAVITVFNSAIGKSSTCTINVVSQVYDITHISATSFNYNKRVGDIFYVDYAALYMYGNQRREEVNQTLNWVSSDTNIATVDKFGAVTCLNPGRVEITASRDGVAAAVSVNIEPVIEIKDLELNVDSFTLNKAISNDYKQLTVNYIPEDTGQKGVIWSSNNPDIASVDSTGMVLVGTRVGSALITCRSKSNSDIFSICNITVIDEVGKYYIKAKTNKVNAVVNKEFYVPVERTSSRYNKSFTAICDNSGVKIRTTYEGFYATFSYGGNYTITINDGSSFDDIEVIVETLQAEPILEYDLELCEIFQTNTYIIRYYVRDQDDIDLTHELKLQGTDEKEKTTVVMPTIHYSDGKEYYYLFGELPYNDTFKMRIEAIDSSMNRVSTRTITVEALDSTYNRENLTKAKAQYDRIREDLVDFLYDMIQDNKIIINERQEYATKYNTYTYAYDSLYKILKGCVDIINEAIEEEQQQMSVITADFVSESPIQTYTVGDYTNSNFESVTDMDYYQNECIKELIRRILTLEALVEELQNK